MGVSMTVSEDLIDRLSSETGRRLAEKARDGRRRAISSISSVAVTVTRDGEATWEEHFDRPPTLGQIVSRVGLRAFIVAVGMRRRPLRDRMRLPLAAE
jgi:hypothetical protein